MKLLKMTIHALKMEWYFQILKISKFENKDFYNKFEYHVEKIKYYSQERRINK